jgi:hypothetical protein
VEEQRERTKRLSTGQAVDRVDNFVEAQPLASELVVDRHRPIEVVLEGEGLIVHRRRGV